MSYVYLQHAHVYGDILRASKLYFGVVSLGLQELAGEFKGYCHSHLVKMDKISRANSLLKEATELLNPTNASTCQSSGSSESLVVRLNLIHTVRAPIDPCNYPSMF